MAAAPFKRAARLSGEIHQIVARALYTELTDPRLKGIQLTETRMTDDLQIVKLYYYAEGGADGRKKAEQGLSSAKGFFKRAISSELDLRLVPDIQFFFDDSMENAENLERLLHGLNKH